MDVFIIVDRKNHITLNVEPTDRVLYLKAQINLELNIPLNQQQISYFGEILQDDRTLKYYSIQNDSALHLKTIESKENQSNKIQIFIKELSGRHYPLFVTQFMTIQDVKKEICKKTGTKPCHQSLIFADKQLEDGNNLYDYSIVNDCTVHMILRLRGRKPVIYLYPENDNSNISVNIHMNKDDGEITSIYPVIKGNDKNTWIVKANQNGEIFYNNRKHYYLFWECLFNKEFVIDEGFVINGQKCYEFFEEKLQYLGLNEREANDFITYWCPKMEHSKYVAIKFQDEDYDKRVPLTVEPKPDSIKRIFMTFKLLDEQISIPAQNLEKFKIEERKGFFVLEWGGAQTCC